MLGRRYKKDEENFPSKQRQESYISLPYPGSEVPMEQSPAVEVAHAAGNVRGQVQS